MNRLFACLLAVAAAGFCSVFAAAPATAQQLQPVDHIVAVVDEDVILRSELDRAVQNILGQYANRQDQLPPRNVLERQVLDRLILVRLQVARAESSGIHISDQETDAAIANVAKQNNVNPEQLRAQLAQDGMSLADLRNTIRDELATQRLRQSFAQSRISISEGEVDAALAVQGSGTQYHLAHLLVALPEGATPEQIATAQNKINGIKALIDKGEMDFAAAAVRYSESPNALEGGDLGWRSLDEIPASFAQTISSLQPGQMLGPIRGPSGFQLLKLVETRAASAAAASTVTEYQARHILVNAGDDAAAKARIDTLRARLAGGADFATVAKENSEDTTTADKGGELSWFAQDAYGPDFGAQVAALQDGQLSAPFKTQAGWHIVQREGSRQSQVTDQNRRAKIRESIGQRKLEEEWDRFLRELRGEAYVDIRLAGAAAAPATAAPATAAPAAAASVAPTQATAPTTPPADGG